MKKRSKITILFISWQFARDERLQAGVQRFCELYDSQLFVITNLEKLNHYPSIDLVLWFPGYDQFEIATYEELKRRYKRVVYMCLREDMWKMRTSLEGPLVGPQVAIPFDPEELLIIAS